MHIFASQAVAGTSLSLSLSLSLSPILSYRGLQYFLFPLSHPLSVSLCLCVCDPLSLYLLSPSLCRQTHKSANIYVYGHATSYDPMVPQCFRFAALRISFYPKGEDTRMYYILIDSYYTAVYPPIVASRLLMTATRDQNFDSKSGFRWFLLSLTHSLKRSINTLSPCWLEKVRSVLFSRENP